MGGEWAGSDSGAEHLSVVQDTELGGALGQLQVEPQRGNLSLAVLGVTLCSAALRVRLMIEVQNYCRQRALVLIFCKFVKSFLDSFTEVSLY